MCINRALICLYILRNLEFHIYVGGKCHQMTFGQRSLVLSKVSVILSSSLAHNNSGRWVGVNQTNETNSTCSDPCAELGRSVQDEAVVLAPLVLMFEPTLAP